MEVELLLCTELREWQECDTNRTGEPTEWPEVARAEASVRDEATSRAGSTAGSMPICDECIRDGEALGIWTPREST